MTGAPVRDPLDEHYRSPEDRPDVAAGPGASWGQRGKQGGRVVAATVDDAVDEQGGSAEHLARGQAAVDIPADPVGHRGAGPVAVERRHVQVEPGGVLAQISILERPLPAEQQLSGNIRFAFRHFPLTGIHPHALAAAAAAEAAARQGRFWDMHELLFHRQKALEDADLLGYAAQLGLDVAAFDRDRTSSAVADRIRRDVDSGLASDQVLGTPTLFIDGLVHRGGYDPPALLAALAR